MLHRAQKRKQDNILCYRVVLGDPCTIANVAPLQGFITLKNEVYNHLKLQEALFFSVTW